MGDRIMTKRTSRKILLAFDGSEGALEAVRYVGKSPSFHEMEVLLFNVYSKIPESYWDLEKQAPLGWRIDGVRAWEREDERKVQNCLKKATKILWRAGFPKEAVKTNIHERKKGIARDILTEAKRGYSCVVVGRKGVSKVKDLILGSVSTKLLEKISFTTLVVVGTKPDPGRILLALDGSENSMRTVDYVGKILGGSLLDLCLINVIRWNKREFVKRARSEIGSVLEQSKRQLMRSGFDGAQISTKIITGAHSRAEAIVNEARKGGYGSIVVGRRGLSKVQDFFIGRVSNKVVQLAKREAVWIVS
jgi:nucleotide-binding universal stress UspA family protein